jgi:peptidoglycan/LPS O-acetylase OafA/YrhL
VFLTPFFLFIEAGLFSIDVFFFVGGFLLAYVFLKGNNSENPSSKKGFTYALAIVQRFLRLWPSYIFAILIYYSVYLHIGDGPFWGMD